MKNLKTRQNESSNIAVSNGMTRVCHSTKRTGQCSQQASRRSDNQFTAVRLAGGSSTRKSLSLSCAHTRRHETGRFCGGARPVAPNRGRGSQSQTVPMAVRVRGTRRCRTARSVMKSCRLMGKSITANNQMRENHHSTENINIFSLRVININHNLSLVVRNFYVVICKLEFQFSYKSH